MPTPIIGTLRASIGTAVQFNLTGSINATYGVMQSTYVVDNVTASSGTLPALGGSRTYVGNAANPVKTEIVGRPTSGVTGPRLVVTHERPIPQQPTSRERYVLTLRHR